MATKLNLRTFFGPYGKFLEEFEKSVKEKHSKEQDELNSIIDKFKFSRLMTMTIAEMIVQALQSKFGKSVTTPRQPMSSESTIEKLLIQAIQQKFGLNKVNGIEKNNGANAQTGSVTNHNTNTTNNTANNTATNNITNIQNIIQNSQLDEATKNFLAKILKEGTNDEILTQLGKLQNQMNETGTSLIHAIKTMNNDDSIMALMKNTMIDPSPSPATTASTTASATTATTTVTTAASATDGKSGVMTVLETPKGVTTTKYSNTLDHITTQHVPTS